MDLSGRDTRHLWHPYTQHATAGPALPVRAAHGARLELEDGREILDAISSWWVTLHGHGEPAIAAAIAQQAARLEQVIFAGFTHEPAVALAERLTAACAARAFPLTRVFFSDNGSTAVEAALKMAVLAQAARGAATRRRFIALHGAYHGDTFGAMAVGDPQGFASKMRDLLMGVDFVAPDDLDGLAALLEDRPGQHAAFIYEPAVQGAAGMRPVDRAFLREAAQRCREAGLLLIADEVFTGFWRTGRCFASEHSGVAPDLMCVAKGLTGGFLPLAATLATEPLFEAFLSSDRQAAFLHGHSYTANPIACAAGVASWDLLQSPATQARITALCGATARHVDALRDCPGLTNARAIGTIGAVDVTPPPGAGSGYFSSLAPQLYAAALARGVLLRPLGNVLYAVPPYCVTMDELQRIYATIRGTVIDPQ